MIFLYPKNFFLNKKWYKKIVILLCFMGISKVHKIQLGCEQKKECMKLFFYAQDNVKEGI